VTIIILIQPMADIRNKASTWYISSADLLVSLSDWFCLFVSWITQRFEQIFTNVSGGVGH